MARTIERERTTNLIWNPDTAPQAIHKMRTLYQSTMFRNRGKKSWNQIRDDKSPLSYNQHSSSLKQQSYGL